MSFACSDWLTKFWLVFAIPRLTGKFSSLDMQVCLFVFAIFQNITCHFQCFSTCVRELVITSLSEKDSLCLNYLMNITDKPLLALVIKDTNYLMNITDKLLLALNFELIYKYINIQLARVSIAR